MNVEHKKDFFSNIVHSIKAFFINFFKKDKNLTYLNIFKSEIKNDMEIIYKNCDRILKYLHQIEKNEKESENIEINFLMPIHDLIQDIKEKKEVLEKNILELNVFFNENIYKKEESSIEIAKNKKKIDPLLTAIKMSLFELNELFYKGIEFDEIIDILEFNQEVVENITGFDKNNNTIEVSKIFNTSETFAYLFGQIKEKTDDLQKKLLIPIK